MSVDFWSDDVAGDDEMGRRHSINLSNGNAADLLAWLGLPVEPGGEAPARDVAARCRRRLWDIPENHDPALPGSDSGEGTLSVVEPDGSTRVARGTRGPRVITFARREGYLRERTQQLLVLAEAAGDGLVRWG
jgi:hypothetical protein